MFPPGLALIFMKNLKEETIKFAPATTSFVEVNNADVTTIIEHARTLITDLMPILTLVMAVGIGLIIITVIIRAIRGH